MVNIDILIRDILTRLQEADERGETEVCKSLSDILMRHGTLLFGNGRYTFTVATAAIYTSTSVVRERIGLPQTITEKVLAKEGE